MIFIFALILFLFVWMKIGDYYGLAVTGVGAWTAAFFKEVSVVKQEQSGKYAIIGFLKKKTVSGADVSINKNKDNGKTDDYILLQARINLFYFTFNTPLTLALIAAFYPFLSKKTVSLDVLLMLIFIHMAYTFSMIYKELTLQLETFGYEEISFTKVLLWRSLSGFLHKMVLRFEPFLLGLYMYLKSEISVFKE